MIELFQALGLTTAFLFTAHLIEKKYPNSKGIDERNKIAETSKSDNGWSWWCDNSRTDDGPFDMSGNVGYTSREIMVLRALSRK